MRAGIVALLALTLVALAGPVQAASTTEQLLDWTEGSFEAGLAGAGTFLFPSDELAPDHERIPFRVNPCHRSLSLGLEYEPRNASARLAHDGTAAEAALPYRFRANLIAPNGTQVYDRIVDEPDLSIFFSVVEEPGEYTLELELLEGALVDWRVRMRGWAVDDPSCGLWLNEVETNPSGPDPGEEWVEIYNEGEQAFDLSGWTIRSNTSLTYEIPENTSVPAGGYEAVSLGGNGSGSAPLANGDETVELVAPLGGRLDASVPLQDTADDEKTWQRSPDGAKQWIYEPGTRGETNG